MGDLRGSRFRRKFNSSKESLFLDIVGKQFRQINLWYNKNDIIRGRIMCKAENKNTS
jgi:hypothetical protein